MFPSYRNHSVVLLCKSADWFFMMGTMVVKGLSNLINYGFLMISGRVRLIRFNVVVMVFSY